MRISVVAVGTRMPSWVTEGIEEYTRRLPRELKLVWTEIPLARRGKDAAAEQWRAAEGEQILKAIAPGERVIALAVDGKRLSTPQLAQNLSAWQLSGDNYSLLIGGPDGLSPSCLARSGAVLVTQRSDPAASAGARVTGRAVVPGLDNYGQPPVSSRLVCFTPLERSTRLASR
jgi:23S rRNA (pseudouridine1915-N3)-methyltransferase